MVVSVRLGPNDITPGWGWVGGRLDLSKYICVCGHGIQLETPNYHKYTSSHVLQF